MTNTRYSALNRLSHRAALPLTVGRGDGFRWHSRHGCVTPQQVMVTSTLRCFQIVSSCR
ncbi:hypothetical protein O9993_15255 [Vibrio lentus]|nr:hypothetical protein [Vibrio lentus]